MVRTTNKKYFKRINIEDMDWIQLPLEESSLQWSHENNTLIIQYLKPKQLMQFEK